MTERIKELLAVLDMPEEDEQIVRLFDFSVISSEEYDNFEAGRGFSLADLAFRLRDEAPTNYLPGAICIVHEYVDTGVNKMYSHNFGGASSWFCFLAQPIHWIIAALIAKELR